MRPSALANRRGSRHLAMFQQRQQPTPLGSVTPPIDLVADQSPVGPAPIHTTDPLGNSSEVVTTLPNDSPYRTRHGREIKRPKHLRDYV